MTKPLIQIDDIGSVREMTDEEHEQYLKIQEDTVELPTE